MGKQADYCISAMRRENGKIMYLRVHTNGETGIGGAIERSRLDIISDIEIFEHIYITIRKDNNGDWTKDKTVGVVIGQTGKYLRTDGNHVEGDHLGNLPEF